ncbi:MAG: hypothetical protein RL197_313 [Actinomycetota bacterium]|jgi:hypothetical protein
MATYPNHKKRILLAYPLAWVFTYLAVMVLLIIWALIPGTIDEGFSPIAIPIVFVLMFLMGTIFYFYVPLAPWLGLLLLHDFLLKDRGGKTRSIVISCVLMLAVWIVTFLPAIALVNVFTAGSLFLQLQDSSAPFLAIYGGTNLVGLLASVVWVKLKPTNAN